MTWIIDASVALKWVIPEVLSDQADRLRAGDDAILAPDLLLVGVANVLWKKTESREISPTEADRGLSHPVDDCVYLALADREQASFVTADRRLLRRVPRRTLRVAVVDLRTI